MKSNRPMRYDWPGLFDELKAAGAFTSDAQLAEHLGVTRAHISAWRNGKSDLGVITKLRVLDALGFDNLHSALTGLLIDSHPTEGDAKHVELISRLMTMKQKTPK